MICRICESTSQFVHQAKILRRYSVRYYYCDHCEYLQTEEPHWLDEAYLDPVNVYDTGILSRNLSLAGIVSTIINFWFNAQGEFLDYAGGYGIFVRLMRDCGYDFYWSDPYCKNLFARGFEKNKDVEPLTMVTCFEAFEHFSNPLIQIQQVANESSNILFSTQLLPDPIPPPDGWWYYGLEHGQHIGFFRKRTLQYLADRFGLDLLSDNHSLHLLTRKSLLPRAIPGSWSGTRDFLRRIQSSHNKMPDAFMRLWDKLERRLTYRLDRYVLVQHDKFDREMVKDPIFQLQLDDLFRYLISNSKHLNQIFHMPNLKTKILQDMDDLIDRHSDKD